MTVVVALLEIDACLIGADSRRTGEEVDQVTMKLRRIPEAPVAWGCSGNAKLGGQFDDWLEKYRWPPHDWPTFERNVRNKLADLNREEREFVERSGAAWEPNLDLTCLLIGWHREKPYIASYYPDGMKGCLEDDVFDHIGRGSRFALVVYTTIKYIRDIPTQIMASIILHATSRIAPTSGLPYNLWRVKSDGDIEEVPMLATDETPA